MKFNFDRKSIKVVVIVFCALFFCLNIVLADFSGSHDGITKIGFPFVFYQDTDGKCEHCENLKLFNIIYLIVDVLVCLLLGIVTVMGAKRIKK